MGPSNNNFSKAINYFDTNNINNKNNKNENENELNYNKNINENIKFINTTKNKKIKSTSSE